MIDIQFNRKGCRIIKLYQYRGKDVIRVLELDNRELDFLARKLGAY